MSEVPSLDVTITILVSAAVALYPFSSLITMIRAH